MSVTSERVGFPELLAAAPFAYGAEVVTTRGFPPPGEPAEMVRVAQALLEDPRIGWISVTDNPGGVPMLPPDWLGRLVAGHRRRVVLHMTCKDMNRNGLEAAAWRYAAEGFDNVLAITGDYPTAGFGGTASPVFDLDSLGLIALLRSMNAGLKIRGRRGEEQALPATRFHIGCVVNPFKRHENELMPQYFKLLRKVRAGAAWVIPQLGYDMCKFHEVKLLLASRGIAVPVVGNVYVLNRAVARLFHEGKLPGCVVTDALLERVEKHAAGPDKGRQFFKEFAARQLAVCKGLGFAAGYLGGISKPETFGEIVELAESYGADDWKDFLPQIRYSQPDEFFLFEHDPATGLSTGEFNPRFVASLKKPVRTAQVTLGYRFSRTVHAWAFTRSRRLYGLMRRLFGWIEKKPQGVRARWTHWMEREAKHLGYGCRDCGDCSLPDCAYLCPLAACSKGSRNGPCGGSCNGRCELGDKTCFWTRVYDRLKYYGETEQMVEAPIVIYNADLKDTSSWANTYLDRDHHAEGGS